MSASIESNSPLATLWRPAGLVYLAFMLAGLAAGIWPEAIHPPKVFSQPAAQPVLQTVAVAQVAFVLLCYPLVLFTRASKKPGAKFLLAAAVESAGLLGVAVPFYIAAAFLSDATAVDVVRTAIYVASLFPLAWVAAGWMVRSRFWRPWAVVDMLCISLGLPAVYYIAREFVATGPVDWLWRLAPVTFAWQLAAPRIGSIIPQPMWAWLIWPALAGASACILLLLPTHPPRRSAKSSSDTS